MNSGKQRSLTLVVDLTVKGVRPVGYPHNYYGRLQFTWNGVTYPSITTLQLATMPIADFNERLAAFNALVESLESGLVIAAVTEAGKEAYKDNLTACPII